MFQPTEFLDGENIIIIGNIPHYRYTGVTYKDKLKNGLSLDYVFYQEDMIPVRFKKSLKDVELKKANHDNIKFDDYEEYYGFYEQTENETLGLPKKGKRIKFKKRSEKNMKKNMFKTNGYSDKLFAVEQEIPDLYDKCRDEIDYDSDWDCWTLC